ncbi:MAG: hypothetical protein M9952_10275 [Microthrixaceae bacterium]|nr:hypothetical protein [Microthrixaceae bacterium]MCO5313301.1 hypothetical protein [Microthrixaceae bacterium]
MTDLSCGLSAASLNAAATAGWYSAVAGLLSGFALLAILIPLDHTDDDCDSNDLSAGAEVFTAAFFTLLILSLTYARLAGETGADVDRGRLTHEMMLNGAALSMSALLLLFALRSILGAYSAARALFVRTRGLILIATAVVGPVIALSSQFASSLDLERYRIAAGRTTCEGALPAGVAINLTILLAGWAIIAGLWWQRRRIRLASAIPTVVARTVLAFTVAVAVWTSVVVPLLDIEVATSPWFEHIVLAATALGGAAIAAASWASR